MYGCHEAIAPDFMLFDYYIGLDTVPGSDRTVKLPYLRHHLQEVHGGKEGLDAHALLASKTGFCNFIYANRKSHPNRDAMFPSSPLSGSSIPWGPILTTPRATATGRKTGTHPPSE